MQDRSSHAERFETLGSDEGEISVRIGPRFLELFSENLYSSPNRAFEELVANSWDAGAEVVHIYIPDDLSDDEAGVWVLDDGESMDLAGLEQLWAVASSAKREREEPPRPQIGKFGIGKLATYILAQEVTYMCRAKDGTIRLVTMDYRRIDDAPSSEDEGERLHIGPVALSVRGLLDEELPSLLETLPGGEQLRKLIAAGVPQPEGDEEYEDGFGGPPLDAPPPRPDTWTIALLTALKEEGRRLQRGAHPENAPSSAASGRVNLNRPQRRVAGIEQDRCSNNAGLGTRGRLDACADSGW